MTPEESSKENASRDKLRNEAEAKLPREFGESDASHSYRINQEVEKDLQYIKEQRRQQRVEAARRTLLTNGSINAIAAIGEKDVLAEIFGPRK